MKNNSSIKVYSILAGIFLLSINFVLAQSTDSAYNNMQFHYGTPESGATGKSTSVDLYNGTLNVNIPLGGYQGRQSSLPLSLSYTGDGVQVEELASNAGLGWNLNFGGRLTSIVNGMPDGQVVTGGTSSQCGFEYSNDNAVRDRYIMTIAGAEREVFFMDNNMAKCLTNPLITVEPHVSINHQWIVHMPDSYTYYFGENDRNETSTTYAGADGTCPATTRTSYSSWLLTKIISPDGFDVYRFEYNDFEMTSAIPNNGEGIAFYGPTPWIKTAQSSYKLKQQTITKVFHNESLIMEMTYKQRDDLKLSSTGSYSGNALDEILFYNFAPPLTLPTPYKKIVFNHSYFGMQTTSTNQDFTKKRLRLDGITVLGIDANNTTANGDEYRFHYTDSPDGPEDFPDIASYAQDYAGLYNGKNLNAHLIPTINGQQRAFSLNYALTGTLDKITYPEKGYSIFEYEQNRTNGSYGIFEIPEMVESTVHEVEVAKIEHAADYCEFIPYEYEEIHGDMLDVDFANYGGSNSAASLGEVRTELLKVPNDVTVNIGTAGRGVYLIQKLPGNITCLPNQDTGCPPAWTINPCLRETGLIYYTGGLASNSSHPADFIAGGMTNEIYGYNGIPGSVFLPAGNYQITLWNDPVNAPDAAKIRLYTTYTTDSIIQAHPETHDIPGTLTDGFRIKSVSNYTGSAIDPATKTEYRYAGSKFCSTVNNTFYDNPNGAYRSSQGYTTGPNVLLYEIGYELQVDGNDTNGYVSYNFKTSQDYYANGLYSSYTLDRAHSGAVMGIWQSNFRGDTLFDGKTLETNTVSKQGILLNSIINIYDSFTYIAGSVEDVPLYQTYTYLSESNNYDYINGATIFTKVMYQYDANSFICQGTSTSSLNDLKQESYLYEEVISNNAFGIRYAGSYDPNLTFHNQKIFGPVGSGLVLVTETKSGKDHTSLETKQKYEYDADGNMVTKIAFTPGVLTPASYESTIYGYNNRIPIVQISGLKYSQLDSAIVAAIKGKSNLPVTPANTILLLNAQKALREWLRTNYPMARAVCSTYNPVYGVTSTTGMTEHAIFYEYDIHGRLVFTKKTDLVNNTSYIVSENRYHTRTNSPDQNWIKQIVYKIPVTAPITDPTVMQATVTLTYLDGLGRPVQKMAGKQSLDQQTGTYSDMSNFIEYDKFGRQAKQYLPYATGTSNFRFDETNAETLAFPEYANEYPYGETEFDGSPLNRIVKSSSPGNETNWAMGSGHEVLYEYGNNDGSVRKFTYANGTILDNGFHKPGTLYKTKTTDEDGNAIEIYKSPKGLTILQRKFFDTSNNLYFDTYYYYDVYNNLIFVAPPKIDGQSLTTTLIDNLCYQYTYDDYNRLVEKKLPEKQSEFIIYDKLNRIVMTGPNYNPMGGDTSNNTDRGWLMNFYDDLGRVAYTGWRLDNSIDSSRRAFLQNGYDTNGVTNVKHVDPAVTIDGMSVNYSDLTAGTVTLLTVNYYDDYEFPHDPINFSQSQVYFNNTAGTKPIGMQTGSWARVLIAGTPVGNTSYTLYDKWARPVNEYKKNYLRGFTKTESTLNFAGEAATLLTNHKRSSSATEIRAKDIFIYNDNSTLKRHYQEASEASGSPSATELLAENEYSKLGRLTKKNVGKSIASPLQSVHYRYNIRGWLTEINDVNDSINNSLFAFKINYDMIDNQIADGVAPRYNGTIAETLWKSNSDNILRRYGYLYDPVNRMTQAIYNKVGANIPTNSYNEYLWYDSNSNIMYAERTGNLDQIGTTNQIDELYYRYKENSNLLEGVYDESMSTIGFKDTANATKEDVDYTYDLNGNLISDLNKGITHIHYNHLNLPVRIAIGLHKISYVYDALGTKVQKVVTDNTGSKTTDYLDGFQYENETLKLFPTTEGYVSCTNISTGYKFNYVYNYKDHLGNIRASFSEEKNELKLLEENHYYPYGLKHANYNSSLQEWGNKEGQPEEVVLKAPPVDPGGTIEQAYKYKFNGQEWQNELALNVYDMDLRDYDPAIARWLNIDPVTHHGQSTYNAFDANPVSIADPSGADGMVYGMAGQSAWSNPFPRGHATFGNGVGMNIARQRGNYDGNTFARNSLSFFGADDSRQNNHGLNEENVMSTNDSNEILKFLLNLAESSKGLQTDYNNIVPENSPIYKALKASGIQDPNANAPREWASIRKVLKIKVVSDKVKGANYVENYNLFFDAGAKTLDYHGETNMNEEMGRVVSIIYPPAFGTWARLALTVAHEGLHMREYNEKKWSPGQTENIRNSEIRAWLQSASLGDPMGLKTARDEYGYKGR